MLKFKHSVGIALFLLISMVNITTAKAQSANTTNTTSSPSSSTPLNQAASSAAPTTTMSGGPADPVATAVFGTNNPLQQTSANRESLPPCSAQGYNFSGPQLVLNNDTNNAQTQRFFLLQNMTNYTVVVNHQDSNRVGAASAGWASKLEGGRASIIALANRPNFTMTCLAYNPPHFGVVNCQSVLSVCVYPPQKNAVGSFWLRENFPSNEVAQAFKQRNIQLNP